MISLKFKILTKVVIAGFVITLGQIGLFEIAYGAESKESNRVAIVVNKYLKQEIEENLNIYLQDLKNEGYEPILREWDLENDPAPKALKAFLKGLYLQDGGLQGAVFIGDLPIPIMEANPVLKEDMGDDASFIRITDGYIAERYYMDLVGKEWADKDKNYKFEELDYVSYWESFLTTVEHYTPRLLKQIIGKGGLYPIPEIWTSRIVTSSLTGLFQKPEGELVNSYLEKNHAYRTGLVVFQKKTLLYSLPFVMMLDSSFSEKVFVTPRRVLSLSRSYEFKEPIPAPATIDEFFKPLSVDSYEILFWGRHGMQTYINLGSDKLMSTELANRPVNVRTAFVFPVSCWIGHYVEPAYFAGSYLFNEHYYALGMPTTTLPSYSGQEVSMMSGLVDGENLGLAFKKAIEVPDFNLFHSNTKYLASRMASSNSRFVLGDGTLKLQSRNLIPSEDNSPQKYLIKPGFVSKNESVITFSEKKEDIELFRKAIELRDIAVIKQLIENGSNVNIKTKDGYTGLDYALAFNNIDIIKLLLENGANPNGKVQGPDGFTPLHNAVVMGRVEGIKHLIEYGADVNAKDNYGHTPLYYAVQNNDIETAKLLIEKGAAM